MDHPPPPETATRRLGVVMSLAAWLAALVLLTLFFTYWDDQRRNPNQSLAMDAGPGGVSEVKLDSNHLGHYVASGTINNSPVVFIVDTGASDIALPLGVADELGLERGARRIYQTANGPAEVYQTRLDKVSLGGIELRDVRASINPGMGGDEVLLGMSFLRHLEFTHRRDTLILRQGP